MDSDRTCTVKIRSETVSGVKSNDYRFIYVLQGSTNPVFLSLRGPPGLLGGFGDGPGVVLGQFSGQRTGSGGGERRSLLNDPEEVSDLNHCPFDREVGSGDRPRSRYRLG